MKHTVEKFFHLRLIGEDILRDRSKSKIFCKARGQRLHILIVHRRNYLVSQCP